jgi:predicted choloylglycine hydrolase
MRKVLISLCLLTVTVHTLILHIGTVPVQKITAEEKNGPKGIYIEKSANSHRHIILEGPSFHIGSEYGRLTQKLLEQQEEILLEEFSNVIKSPLLQKIFFMGSMLWFNDLDSKISNEALKEMQGVSIWAPSKFKFLASNLTRQVAYHGLHEVGQMFVDEDKVDMGCFVAALQGNDGTWIIGRNFDFDVNNFFDKEKILKWVYPEKGIPYLSIIWAGMVGAVTGVNQNSIFVSINAAGSDDFSRIGTPTTLVVKKILQTANNIDEALKVLRESKTFITEIFIVGDMKSQKVYKIEKSPKRISITKLNKSSVISNHLTDSLWIADKTNSSRIRRLTTNLRYKRGIEILKTLDNFTLKDAQNLLRDKLVIGTNQIHNGHRGAIDSMIASQSVIYDMKEGILYISLGPGTNGKYVGYDLKMSFDQKKPIVVKNLDQDILVSNLDYKKQRTFDKNIKETSLNLSHGKCIIVKEQISSLMNQGYIHYNFDRVQGDYQDRCNNDLISAKKMWVLALKKAPPFENIVKYLKGKINE